MRGSPRIRVTGKELKANRASVLENYYDITSFLKKSAKVSSIDADLLPSQITAARDYITTLQEDWNTIHEKLGGEDKDKTDPLTEGEKKVIEFLINTLEKRIVEIRTRIFKQNLKF